jgi:CHAT domain-containing protein/tetratricopeptide (TPR) repeat protein
MALSAESRRKMAGGLAVLSVFVIASRAVAGDAETLNALYQQGYKDLQAERYSEAAKSFEKAVAIAPNVHGRGRKGMTHLNTAILKEFLAKCYLEELRTAEAEQIFRELVQIGQAEEGARSPMMFRAKNDLGEIYRLLHQSKKSEDILLEVVREDPDLRGRAITSNNLGYLFLMQERLGDARAFFEYGRTLLEKSADRDGRLNFALSVHGLGMVEHKEGKPQLAEPLFRQGLNERQRQQLPNDHRWIAHSKGMLAAVNASLGRDDIAKPLLADAERAMRKFWGDNHLDVAMELHEEGLLLARAKDVGGAVLRFDEARRIGRRYTEGVLKSLGTEEQLRFLAEERSRFMDVVAVARQFPENADLVRHSFEWTLNEKGIAQQTLAERELLVRDASRTPEARTALEALSSVREQLMLLATKSGVQAKDDINRLTSREIELLHQLGVRGGQGDSDPWVRRERVCAALPEDSLLVEIVRLDRTQPMRSAFDARPKEARNQARYVAWTATRNGIVRLIDLGEAGPIDDAIQDLRQFVNDGQKVLNTIKSEGERIAEQEIVRLLQPLSRALLLPLLKDAGPIRHLIISPDASTWLVPWSALPLAEGRYAVEDFEIGYVVSGRDLASTRGKPQQLPKAPAIFASPDFDLEPDQVGVRSPRKAVDPKHPAMRLGNLLDGYGSFGALPQSLQEARGAEPRIKRYSNDPPNLYTGADAVEGTFKSVERPDCLLISTHGFFLPPKPEGSSANPLLRCGLAFAGCNSRKDIAPEFDDGILTGLEIMQSDLRGTRLVVLSACETGLGDVRNAEGVAGLRQAFQLAGAQAVVSALWQAEDTAASQLMDQFFAGLAVGKTKSEALRTSQLDQIERRRKRSNAAHPFLWAPFTLTGEAR